MLAGPRRAELVSTRPAEPGPGEVGVRIEGSGVCGSNVPLWEGRPWFDYPLEPGAPGHEGWGRIETVGEGVYHLEVGDRVAFLHERAFAESAVAPAAVVVPFGFPGPFPGEALACAFNAVRRAHIVRGQSVAVVGVGFLGAVIVARAAHAGAHVVAVSRRRYSLDVARAMGAHEVLGLGEHVPECDVVFEAAGFQQPLDVASGCVREGGRLVIAGFHQDGLRTVDLCAWNWKGIDVVNAHERDRHVVVAAMREAAEAIERGELDPSPLYTHEVPLDRLGEAMDAMVERPDGFMKALVRT